MTRDIFKEVSRGAAISREHKALALSAFEYYRLYDDYRKTFSEIPEHDEKMKREISEAGFRAITQAFNAGLSIGYRNGKNAAKKKMAQTSKNN